MKKLMLLVFLILFVKLNKINKFKKRQFDSFILIQMFFLFVCLFILMYLFNIHMLYGYNDINMLMQLKNLIDFVVNEEVLLYMHHVE